jgi:cytochrome c553
MSSLRLAALIGFVGCGVACGGAAPAPARTPAEPAASDEWSKASWEERHATMTWRVLPSMARTFQHFERSEVPSLTCRTCHGADAEERSYQMPNAGLAALDPAELPRPESSPIARFMHEEVVPQMRDLLGSPTLSCFQCHPRRGGQR